MLGTFKRNPEKYSPEATDAVFGPRKMVNGEWVRTVNNEPVREVSDEPVRETNNEPINEVKSEPVREVNKASRVACGLTFLKLIVLKVWKMVYSRTLRNRRYQVIHSSSSAT